MPFVTKCDVCGKGNDCPNAQNGTKAGEFPRHLYSRQPSRRPSDELSRRAWRRAGGRFLSHCSEELFEGVLPAGVVAGDWKTIESGAADDS